MHPTIDVITLGVHDLSGAAAFYEAAFGFPVRDDDSSHARLELGLGSSALELRPWDALAESAGASPESSGFRGFTLSYIVESWHEVDELVARAERAGGVISKPPRTAVWGYSAYVTDPSGHLWKIASSKRKPLLGRKDGNGAATPIKPQELVLTIGVGDMKRGKQFYKDELAWPTRKDYSKFVLFDGGGATPDLALYRWDTLADDAGVAPTGSGFRGFAISHAGRTYVADPDGCLVPVAARAAYAPR